MSLVNASNWKDVTRNLLVPEASLHSKLGSLPYRAYLCALGAWKLRHYSFPDISDPAWCRDSLAHYRRTSGSWAGQSNGGVPMAMASRH